MSVPHDKNMRQNRPSNAAAIQVHKLDLLPSSSQPPTTSRQTRCTYAVLLLQRSAANSSINYTGWARRSSSSSSGWCWESGIIGSVGRVSVSATRWSANWFHNLPFGGSVKAIRVMGQIPQFLVPRVNLSHEKITGKFRSPWRVKNGRAWDPMLCDPRKWGSRINMDTLGKWHDSVTVTGDWPSSSEFCIDPLTMMVGGRVFPFPVVIAIDKPRDLGEWLNGEYLSLFWSHRMVFGFVMP